jgi:uncharacterized protein
MNQRWAEHLAAKERRAVRAFVRVLREQLTDQVLEAMLYGSKARGNDHPWSDIDILILVAEESWPLRAQVSTLAADISLHYSVLLAPRIVGLERWERMKQASFGLYRNVATEGIPLPLPALRAA